MSPTLPALRHSERQRIFFFSHVRTRSNLFMKVLGEDPQINKIMYPFFFAYKYGPEPLFHREAPIYVQGLSRDTREETYQKGFDVLMAKILAAEENDRIPFIMNHAYFVFDPDVIATNLEQLYGSKQRSKLRVPSIIDRSRASVFEDAEDIGKHRDKPETVQSQSNLEDHNPSQYPSNPTILPMSFLQSITAPIFLIRHPARLVPSFYRAARDAGYDVSLDGPEFQISATIRWVRLLFDFFAANAHNRKAASDYDEDSSTNSGYQSNSSGPQPNDHPLPQPILMDADDVLHDPSLMSRLCARLGLDPSYLQYSWDPASPEVRQANGPALAVFQRNLHDSKGISAAQRETDQGIDMEEERANLVQEFGEEIGEGLWRFVEAGMADWTYLMKRKF